MALAEQVKLVLNVLKFLGVWHSEFFLSLLMDQQFKNHAMILKLLCHGQWELVEALQKHPQSVVGGNLADWAGKITRDGYAHKLHMQLAEANSSHFNTSHTSVW
ncbi:hypothetical protein PAXRUDRAFT_179952 [Paxillus rubicundulus Ve08.2h10]|uniref:Uncharacterized protein n=1 Tax=Paxillus rubicundulus Ve08.2h10 TaxID=930991 RepID=A0A0D0CZ49_9AGAM|nr:hypothetical protein PAXRUDRAFT_179952 [Paxillus rubicundulus Ve08.2h10]